MMAVIESERRGESSEAEVAKHLTQAAYKDSTALLGSGQSPRTN